MKKTCTKCGKEKLLTEFHKRHDQWSHSKLVSQCKECNRKRQRKYTKDHPGYDRNCSQRSRDRLKEAVMNAYSNGMQTCAQSTCGQCDLDVLSIDHINNDGAEHRKAFKGSDRLYRWLQKHDYPSGFQVLCFNCNMKKRLEFERSRRIDTLQVV